MKKIFFYKAIPLLISYLILNALGFDARAQDYIGADAILRQVEARNANPVTKTNDAAAQLRDDLKSFGQNASSLPPADAAKRWLELVDRAAEIQQLAGHNFNPSEQLIDGNDLLSALPPPAIWGVLAKAIAKRPHQTREQGAAREMGLRLLVATLTGNAKERNLEITNLEAKANESDNQMAFVYVEFLGQLRQAMLATADDPNVIINSLEQQISQGNGGNPTPLQVPNLVSQVGPEKAEAFLRKALLAPGVILQFGQPDDTSRLAQKLALELMDQLKTPQWGLVNSLDAVELYEAMDRHFGGATNNSVSPTTSTVVLPPGMNVSRSDFMGDNQKSPARIYYMLGLISRGRTQDAVAVAKQSKGFENYEYESAFDAMDRAGYDAELDDFLYLLLSQNPALPFWNEYVEFAAKAGKTERMVALVRSTLARSDVSDSKKPALHQILFTALLAANNVDEGVREMRRSIAANDTSSESGQNYNNGQLGAMLARIGVLMTNSEWTEAGITAAKRWLATQANGNANWEVQPVLTSLTQTLLDLNRGPEAESILADALANATRLAASQPDMSVNQGGPARPVLTTLAILYYKAGRYDDVLDLLQNSPDWGAKDLSELGESDQWEDPLSMVSLHTPSSPLPVPYIAAAALAAKGRTEEAQRITDALLDSEPALDRGYELLILLKGTNAIPRLDELFKGDQFQTRPLIWKAYLLEKEGRLEEAEKTVRQAITIDPSDGEEGRGDRMRAYAELADICEARGDQKDADFNREIVKAIRVAEDADQFYMAGLLKRAIAMYQEGLDHFSDAYCIQSRLAIQLAALGKNEEAAEHYRRAYELMPDSFGRVESHCFGCERVFDGEQAQSIAEKVFTGLVAARPNKPQVYYLLGYLQTEEDRYNAAWTNFQTAVRLDPDYLNAWDQLQGVSQQILVSPEKRDEIAFNILHLDPLQRHTCPDFSSVSDLARLWNAEAAAERLRPKPLANLFELEASKMALEKNSNNSSMQERIMQMESESQNQTPSPARAIAQTPYVTLAGQLILNNNFNSDQY